VALGNLDAGERGEASQEESGVVEAQGSVETGRGGGSRRSPQTGEAEGLEGDGVSSESDGTGRWRMGAMEGRHSCLRKESRRGGPRWPERRWKWSARLGLSRTRKKGRGSKQRSERIRPRWS
jgi:hypothetical protein